MAQPALLHYTETSGFDHLTRAVSLAMFQQIGGQYGFTVDHDSTGDAFNTLAGLQQYAVVVFSNTTGDAILDPGQRANFEMYMTGGGHLLGIHSATDTYRHSSANGTNTGTWDFFAETLGGSVQQNPNHVNGTPSYNISTVMPHQVLAGLPDPWFKAEEYYYWESGYLNPSNQDLQKVEQTVGPNSMVNSYDSARAVTWIRPGPGGGMVFYTSLGHAASNYTADTLFRNLIRNALLWMVGTTSTAFAANPGNVQLIIQNPWPKEKNLEIFVEWKEKFYIELLNQQGQRIACKSGTGKIMLPTLLPAGLYLIRYTKPSASGIKKVVFY